MSDCDHISKSKVSWEFNILDIVIILVTIAAIVISIYLTDHTSEHRKIGQQTLNEIKVSQEINREILNELKILNETLASHEAHSIHNQYSHSVDIN